MNKDILINIIIFIILLLMQVVIFNHIMLFNVAMAFVFIYIIIRMPMQVSVNWLLTIGFLSGLLVDIMSDTPGVNALACTILAALKRPALYAYIPRDDRTKNIRPTVRSLGFTVYAKFLLTMSAIYCVLAFSIEYFSFANVKEIAIMSGSSCILTFLLLIGIDSLEST